MNLAPLFQNSMEVDAVAEPPPPRAECLGPLSEESRVLWTEQLANHLITGEELHNSFLATEIFGGQAWFEPVLAEAMGRAERYFLLRLRPNAKPERKAEATERHLEAFEGRVLRWLELHRTVDGGPARAVLDAVRQRLRSSEAEAQGVNRAFGERLHSLIREATSSDAQWNLVLQYCSKLGEDSSSSGVTAALAESTSGLAASTSSTGSAPLPPTQGGGTHTCLLYTSPSPRDGLLSRMPSSA